MVFSYEMGYNRKWKIDFQFEGFKCLGICQRIFETLFCTMIYNCFLIIMSMNKLIEVAYNWRYEKQS